MILKQKIENESVEEKISRLTQELEKCKERYYYKDYHGNEDVRLEKHIALLKLGCEVEDDHHGLLVNNKFIVGVKQPRWCVVGKYKWYWYTDIPSFVSKYVNKDVNNDKMDEPLPNRR